MVSARNPLYARLKMFANYLLSCYHVGAKQTASCQSADDELQKCARLFRYSYWLLRKSIFKLANRTFADFRHVRGRKSGRI